VFLGKNGKNTQKASFLIKTAKNHKNRQIPRFLSILAIFAAFRPF